MSSETITYPENCRAIVDVTQAPYHCDPTGAVDCTAALIRALDDIVRPWRQSFAEQETFYAENPFEYTGLFEARKSHGPIFHPVSPEAKILYFPAGTYQVSDTIRYTLRDLQNCNRFELPQLIQFRGEAEDRVVIKLTDDNPRFSLNSERAVIDVMGGIYTNAAFHNSVENLTIDIGSGNPGAVGLGFFCNNTGAVRHVTIRSSDPEQRGAMGLAIRHRNMSAALLQHLTIEGFDTGIFVGYDRLNTVLEHIHVSGQHRTGIHIDRHNVSLRALTSDNRVPALTITSREAVVAFVEGELRGGDGSRPAIDLRDGHLFVRDVTTDGYSCALQHQGSPMIQSANIVEYAHGGVKVMFPEEARRSLSLPIEETPSVAWQNDHSQWACVNDFGATGDGTTNDTAAVQAAMTSGKPVIWFQPGCYLIDDVIDVPASVQRVNFMKADLAAGPNLRLQHGAGGFRIAEHADDPVILEDLFAMEGWRGGMALVDHASTRTLVLSDIHMHFCAAYRNSVRGGKVFIENVFAMNQFRPEIPIFDFRGQQVWARQINPERNNPQIRNDNGSLWVLGFKTEHSGTAYLTRNGGRTEVLGGTFNQGFDPKSPALIVNDQSDVSVVASTTDFRELCIRSSTIVEERRGEAVRQLPASEFPKRDANLIAMPLYVGRARPESAP